MVDGRIVACTSEERFSRRKNDEVYPQRAVEFVLRQAGLSPTDLDCVALAGERFDPKYILCRRYSGFSIEDHLREQRDYWYPRLYEGREVEYLDLFKDKLDFDQFPAEWDEVVAFQRNGRRDVQESNEFFQAFRRRTVSRHLGIDPKRVVFPHHHRCHGFYAYYASPLRTDALILTADAWGDDMNASVSLARNGNIARLSSSANFNLGRLYRFMTLLLGMKPDEHEYKVMGLAAYAKPEYFHRTLQVFRETMYVDGLGFAYHLDPPDWYAYFRDRLEGHRFDAIAGAVQRYTEEILVQWTHNCLAATGARRLCFGGGLAMNVKAMMEITQLDELDEIFVCPSPSDESLAIGASYVVMHDHCVDRGVDPRAVLGPLRDVYLGPDLNVAEMRHEVRRLAASGRYLVREGVNPTEIAKVLGAGRIVGRCVGRSEFGARALGNRSILADPRKRDVVRRINETVKSRDFWMPFAPSILEERAGDYLVNPKGLAAPYMTVAFRTTPRAQTELPAALHDGDLTCRPQVVRREINSGYHGLIREFERLTGVGAILNTSFNIHGEPIVQTAGDAVAVFERSGLDACILGDYFIERENGRR